MPSLQNRNHWISKMAKNKVLISKYKEMVYRLAIEYR